VPPTIVVWPDIIPESAEWNWPADFGCGERALFNIDLAGEINIRGHGELAGRLVDFHRVLVLPRSFKGALEYQVVGAAYDEDFGVCVVLGSPCQSDQSKPTRPFT
jgi:hypothetical protein